jgi:hypothetical protein
MRTDGLRPIVEAVDREVSRLAGRPESAASAGALVASWAELVEYLALGPAPDLRTCPACGGSGMRLATVCGHCWGRLVPPAPATSA